MSPNNKCNHHYLQKHYQILSRLFSKHSKNYKIGALGIIRNPRKESVNVKGILPPKEQAHKHNTGKIRLNRAKPLIEKAIILNPTQTTRWSNGAHETKKQENSKRNLLHTQPINQTTQNPIQDTQTKMENK